MLHIDLDHICTFLCVWWELIPNAAVIIWHKQQMSHMIYKKEDG